MRIRNKEVSFLYNFEKTIDCGMVLTGDEVKSMRKSAPSLKGCFGFLAHEEIFLKNFSLKHSVKPDRDKKLLLHKKEIKKIIGLFSQKAYIIAPVELYENDKGLFKMLVGFGYRLKKIDLREKIKDREVKLRIKRDTIDS